MRPIGGIAFDCGHAEVSAFGKASTLPADGVLYDYDPVTRSLAVDRYWNDYAGRMDFLAYTSDGLATVLA